ncbi:MAG TPA: S-layer homology domain-containing protein [Chloroflexia bacterium]|nr:S-layer homology domain-containing protein [Chloroflexia bacterium]
MLRRYGPTCALFLVLLAAVAVAWSTPPAPARAGLPPDEAVVGTSTPPPACGAAWRVVPGPTPTGTQHALRGLATVAPNNVWAVGYTGSPYGPAQTLIEHWDGAAWSLVSSPNGGSGNAALLGVAAVAANDVWAVGRDGQQTLTLHWNGTAWTAIPSPSVAGNSNWLYGVAAVAANDVWAVGYYGMSSGDSRTLILHWNGAQWSIVASPNVGSFENELYAVTALSANDIWAVGRIGQWGTRERTLTLHWDGISWNVLGNPNTPIGEYTPYAFYGVAGRASNDVWAVGAYRNNSWSQTLIEHWDGSAWSIVASPNGNLAGDNEFHAVAVDPAGGAWAAGYFLDNGFGGYHPLAARLNGSAWALTPAPYPGPDNDRLFGVAVASPGSAWAVGQQGPDANATMPLILRYADPCSTPSPQPTGSPPTATATGTPVCTLGWSVVPSGNNGAADNHLLQLAGVSPNEQWAVGYYTNGSGVEQTLIEHRAGGDWTLVPSPNGGSGGANRLQGVTALAADDAWAVGDYAGASGRQTLIEHWDGSTWAIVASPNPGTQNYLNAVTAVAADDIWAVGNSIGTGGQGTLLLHWNGSTWSVVPGLPPSPYYGRNLLAVSAAAANDVWAVGTIDDAVYPNTLILHWNGSGWSQVASPSPGVQYVDTLTGVTALATNNAWAVGYNSFNGVLRNLTLHWDGTAWSVVSSPNVGAGANMLNAVAASSGSEVWAVGAFTATVTQTLALRWSGSTWGIANPPSPGAGGAGLSGVAIYPGSDLWAVGEQRAASGSPARTLVIHNAAACSTPTPTRTATRTPTATPTVTGTPPTATPSRTATPTPTSTLSPTPQPSCVPSWHLAAGPTPGTTGLQLYGVAARTTGDVWAVGDYHPDGTPPGLSTLTQHWNGSTWTSVPSPSVAGVDNHLYRVAMVTQSDVWAIGDAGSAIGAHETLILHWDGAAWSRVASPNPGTSGNYLYSISALAANDIWAVGEQMSPTSRTTLTIHWDGTSWQAVPSASRPGQTTLYGVKTMAADDVWAVGMSYYYGGQQTVIEHWNGQNWSIVASPNAGTGGNALADIAGTGPNDLWALGSYQVGAAGQTMTLHWDGSNWTQVSSPSPSNQYLYMRSITAFSPSDVWAVGDYEDPYGETLILHWDGTSWRRVSSPNGLPYANNLLGVAGATPEELWAVGYTYSPGSEYRGLLLHTTLDCSTPCPVQFSDVPANSPFYPYVRCLVCRGIVSGYADGTFRPGNPITRGQTAKLVANAAGFQDVIPSTQQTFSDVPITDPFWIYVERLARPGRGYISGYTCGAPPAGACDPLNRPWFLPYNNVTRGQIAKVVANAAGLNSVVPSTQQTFSDVPASNAFWVYVERLAPLNVISGYICGSPPAGACDPQNRPYFLPFNSATRGQTSKVVANTFFPGCQTPAP